MQRVGFGGGETHSVLFPVPAFRGADGTVLSGEEVAACWAFDSLPIKLRHRQRVRVMLSLSASAQPGRGSEPRPSTPCLGAGSGVRETDYKPPPSSGAYTSGQTWGAVAGILDGVGRSCFYNLSGP